MRPAALLCLIIGILMQGLLDGQTFTHAVSGIVLGGIAIACGLASARKDPPHHWEGRIMAALGLALGVWCIIMLPSSYRFQKQFNDRKHRQKLEQQNKSSNQPDAVNRPSNLL